MNAELLKREILELKQKGHTIIFSTHNMASVEEICDKIALINHSEVVLQGEVKEVRSRFKTDTYTLVTQGDVLLQDTPLFEAALKEEEGQERYYTVRKLQDVPNTVLLSELGKQTEILSFAECIPSMNEIFIRTVEGKNNQ